MSSIDQPAALPHAARRTEEGAPSLLQMAWLYRARQMAREMVLPTYSEKALREAVTTFKQFMVDPEEARHVSRVLTECGVRFVIVESLPNAKIDGACFWLYKKSPVIGLSLRFDRIDNYWFVLRHEIEHVLQKHGQATCIVDSELEGGKASFDGDIPKEERVANRAATDFCVPIEEMNLFIAGKSPFFSERDLLGFAKRLQVHPGIVAGQLRKRLNRWDLFTKMLVKIRHAATSGAVVDGWGEVAQVLG